MCKHKDVKQSKRTILPVEIVSNVKQSRGLVTCISIKLAASCSSSELRGQAKLVFRMIALGTTNEASNK